MIQRIQSIYLLVGAIALACLLLFDDIWSGPEAEQHTWFAPALLTAAGLSALIALVAIFLYKDRRRQRGVVVWAQLLALITFIVLLIGLTFGDASSEASAPGYATEYAVAVLIPMVAYVLFYLARRAIDRDIALIRSMNRLR